MTLRPVLSRSLWHRISPVISTNKFVIITAFLLALSLFGGYADNASSAMMGTPASTTATGSDTGKSNTGTSPSSPSLRVQVNQKGDYVLIGNTLAQDTGPGVPAPVFGSVGATGSNTSDFGADVFWRADDPSNGQASANTTIIAANARSTAVLNVPSGASVTHAYLYWSAIASGGVADTTALIERPGDFSQPVTAVSSNTVAFGGGTAYLSVADVTSLVQNHGSGAYRVGDVDSQPLANLNSDAAYAGWGLLVLYKLSTDPLRTIIVNDGLEAVSNGAPVGFTLSGFLVPNAGFTGKLGMLAFSGHDQATGDSLFFNGGAALSDGLNPFNNFFNSTRSFLGVPINSAGDLPRLTGEVRSMSGVDLDTVDVTAKLTAGQTNAPVQASTTGESFLTAVWVASVSTVAPDFNTSACTIADLNGGSLNTGDVLELTCTAVNTGNDTSVNTALSIPLPAGVTYQPGSLQVVSGPNNGAKTDVAGDDQAEYVAGTQTAVLRLGSGANAANGGSLAINGTTVIRFRFTANAGTTAVSTTASLTAAGQLGSPTTTFSLPATLITPPTITADGPLTRQQDSAAINSTIATVSDTFTGILTVTATTVPTGISVTDIVNTGGIVTADVAAGCNAATGANTVVLTVTNNTTGLTNTANLTVNVTVNTPPVLSYLTPQMVVPGQSLTVNPVAPPSDNGSVASIVVQNVTPSTAPGTITVDNLTGVVTVPNNVPAGNYTVTIRATDNCGGMTGITDASFVLNVVCPAITVNPPTLPNGFVGTPYNQPLSASGGTPGYTFTLLSGTLPNNVNIVGTSLMGTPTTTGVFTFTLKATDSMSCFGTRAYQVVISGTGLQFYPLAHPIRLVDTRPSATACQAPGVPITGGASLTVPARVTCDSLTIPANAAAVTGNVTTVGPVAGGILTIYPSSAVNPGVSNSNYQTGQTLNNVFTVGLGPGDGAFKVFSSATTNVVVDITGYFAPPGAGGLFFHTLPAPVRLLDTRAMATACTTPGAPLLADTEFLQQGNAICGIPATALALVGNATTVGPIGPGFLTLFPADVLRPFVASGNYQMGQTLNSPFNVGLSPSGQFKIYVAQQTNLVVDVLGYYSADALDVIGIGLLFSPMTPARLLDTRPAQPACFMPGVPIPATTDTPQAARGVCTIPATAQAIVGNATTVLPAAGGFLTFWPSDAMRPFVATSNYAASVNFNRHYTVGLGADGAFKIYASTSTNLVIDVSGSFAP